MRFITKPIFVFCVAALTLGGCSGARDQLGLNKKVPDEFSVAKRAPLAMPPSYELVKPRPGAPRPQEADPRSLAQETLFGEQVQTTSARDLKESENLLLQKAGAGQANPEIRNIVDEESETTGANKQATIDKLLGGVGLGDSEGVTLVDPAKEAERIRKNIEDGKPVTEGETPYIQ